jgi:hypothetical protein
MSAPAHDGPLQVRVCRKGADPTTDAVTVTLDPSVFPRFGKGLTGWGIELSALLKGAARVCDIGRLSVWYAAEDEEEDLPQNRGGWNTVTSMMGPADVIVVEGRQVDEDTVFELPDEEQNSKRLYDLYLGGSCVVREALQEVSCAPKLLRALTHSSTPHSTHLERFSDMDAWSPHSQTG